MARPACRRRRKRAGVSVCFANAPGAEIQEVCEKYDRNTTDRTFDVAFGTVEAGTCAAARIQAIGVVDGCESIVIEHVTRLAHDIAPDWPTGVGDLSYRVVVDGEPNIDCTMAVTLDDPRRAGIAGMKADADAMVATAMRVVNAVHHVVAAPPGLLSSLHLPLTLPQHTFAAA